MEFISTSPDPSLFDDRSPEYSDHHNPFKVQLASTPYQREGQPEYLRKQEGEQRIGNADNKVLILVDKFS